MSGLDSQRVAMVNAVVERRGGVKLADADVFAASVGGVRIAEPAADLALALAIASAVPTTAPFRAGMIALGEVGLSGEIRRVGGTGRRLAEAARQGYTVALSRRTPAAAPRHDASSRCPTWGRPSTGCSSPAPAGLRPSRSARGPDHHGDDGTGPDDREQTARTPEARTGSPATAGRPRP